jgi:hypothetical protein
MCIGDVIEEKQGCDASNANIEKIERRQVGLDEKQYANHHYDICRMQVRD